jgi:hypothetical protein
MRAFPMQNSSADRVRDMCSKRLAPGDTIGVQRLDFYTPAGPRGLPDRLSIVPRSPAELRQRLQCLRSPR